MGWRETSRMRRQVRSVRGQLSGGPSGVAAQLKARMAAPISPPPARKSGAGRAMDLPWGDLPWMTFISGGCPDAPYQLPTSTPQAVPGSKSAKLVEILGG